MFGFGSRVLAAGLMNTVFDRVQLLLIGKVFGPADLGYYTRAYSTQQMPAERVPDHRLEGDVPDVLDHRA